MIKNIKKLLCVFLSLFSFCYFLPFCSQTADAVVEKSNDLCEKEGEGECEVIYNNDRVIVSMGDSYSSGEGVEDFYGSNLPLGQRIKNEDWLCHRSENAWSGMLKLKSSYGDTITMNKSRADDNTKGNWYFVAMSGAETVNIIDTTSNPDIENEYQKKRFKEYYKKINPEDRNSIDERFNKGFIFKDQYIKGAVEIEPQLNVFDKVKQNNQKAEYVTITMGGNDIGFTEIITTAIFNINYLQKKPSSMEIELSQLLGDSTAGKALKADVIAKMLYSNSSLSLKKKMKTVEDKIIPETIEKLRTSYGLISSKAGDQAHIIVAGYPHVISTNAKYNSLLFRVDDAETINHTIDKLNDEISKLVKELHDTEGMNIVFCDVTKAFGNNGAYANSSKNGELINRMMPHKSQDISDPYILNPLGAISAYSIHPNKQGVEKYADNVQNKIDYYEKRLTLTGNVTDTEANPNPLEETAVTVETPDGKLIAKTITSAGGEYLIIPNQASEYGQKYKITFDKEGYEPFTVYETTDKKTGNNITINVKLVHKCFNVNVSGTVTDEKGNPIDGAEVTITGGYKKTKETKTAIVDGIKKQMDFYKIDRTQKDTQTVYTDNNGKYEAEFVNDKSDDYNVVVKKNNYDTYTDNITIEQKKIDNNTWEDVKYTYDITLEDGMYKAYCEIVRGLVKKYGEGRYSTQMSKYLTGLAVVRLVDFDGDGREELFCAYNGGEYASFANTQEVYRYDNGKAVSIYKGQTDSEGGVGPYVEYMITEDKAYLLTDAHSEDWELGSWILFNKNDNSVQFSYNYNYNYENNKRNYVYMIDGKTTTESDYNSRKKAFTDSGTIHKILIYPPYNKKPYEQGGDEVLKETKEVMEKIGYKNQ